MPNLEVPLPVPSPQVEPTRVNKDPSAVEKKLERDRIEKEAALEDQKKEAEQKVL